MLLGLLLTAMPLAQEGVEGVFDPVAARWDVAREALPADMHPGLDFLLEHMPETDRRELDVELVVENVEYAYKAWREAPWHADVPEAIFLNEILPYASINERRDRWRKDFHERYGDVIGHAKSPGEAAAILNNHIFADLGVIYSTQRPKADQSPYESIDAKMASCTGLSILLIAACRSQGIPARFVGTPLWADGSGNHSWVEVWDDGWHFTGAAEPTGIDLNKAWFTNRASQAIADDRERAIYATSWKRTSLSLPMVWRPDSDEVPAVNVTARYLKQEALADGMARVRVRARISNDGLASNRVMAKVVLKGGDNGEIGRGFTRNESFDLNDILTFTLPIGATIDLDAELGHQSHELRFIVKEDGSMVDLVFGDELHAAILDPREQLWDRHRETILRERAREMAAEILQIGRLTFRFGFETYGEAPSSGHALYISLHGGGGAPAEVNDQQWANQRRLYQPAEGIYLAPRAPTDTWNLWHQDHVDAFLDRLIENMIVFHGVDPNRVYLMGYSAGGDGVYQLAPRMADRFAAAAMMAGHPNDARPDSLANLPFTLHMGAEDAAYDRNKVAAQWKEELAALEAAAAPGAYPHWVEIHEGKGHWMDREDASAVPWMAKHVRELRPQRVVWLQDDVVHDRFYWLQVDEPKARSRVVVSREGNRFTIEQVEGLETLTLRMDQSMIDFAEEVVVVQGEEELFRGLVTPSLDVQRRTLAERGDPSGIFAAELRLDLP
jgi:predicted esterase